MNRAVQTWSKPPMRRTRRPQSAAAMRLLSLFVLLFSLHSARGANMRAGVSRSVRNHSSPARTQEPPNTEESKTLELGQSVEREIAGGQKHHYEILLSEGQYMRVEIKPQGILLLPGSRRRARQQSHLLIPIRRERCPMATRRLAGLLMTFPRRLRTPRRSLFASTCHRSLTKRPLQT